VWQARRSKTKDFHAEFFRGLRVFGALARTALMDAASGADGLAFSLLGIVVIPFLCPVLSRYGVAMADASAVNSLTFFSKENSRVVSYFMKGMKKRAPHHGNPNRQHPAQG
jgi:hypothetical protein